jgi:ABC-type multidrug transport system fused ATPase/permease subunit
MMLAVLSIVPILLGGVVLLVVSLIVMMVLSPPLTLIALLMLPLLLVTGLKMRNAVFHARGTLNAAGGRCRRRGRHQRARRPGLRPERGLPHG